MDPLPLLSLNPAQLKAIFYQAARNTTVKQCQGTGWAALTPTRLELCCLESSPAAPQCPSWLEKWHKGHRAITEPEWGGEEHCPLITHSSLSPQAIAASMHKGESPWELYGHLSGHFCKVWSFQKDKDLQLGLPWPRQRTRWVEDEGGQNDTSPSGSFLDSFSLPLAKNRERNEVKLFERLKLNSQSFRTLKPHFRVNLVFLQGFHQLLPHSWFYFLTGYGVLRGQQWVHC